MLTADGTVRVLDFGIATALQPPDGPRLTHAGMVAGTPGFISPEQGKGQAATPLSDLYALGCVLYEILGGRPPFTADEPLALVVQHIADTPVLLDRLRDDAPAELCDLVSRLLAKRPEDRPADAAEVREALAPWAEQAVPKATRAGTSRPDEATAAPHDGTDLRNDPPPDKAHAPFRSTPRPRSRLHNLPFGSQTAVHSGPGRRRVGGPARARATPCGRGTVVTGTGAAGQGSPTRCCPVSTPPIRRSSPADWPSSGCSSKRRNCKRHARAPGSRGNPQCVDPFRANPDSGLPGDGGPLPLAARAQLRRPPWSFARRSISRRRCFPRWIRRCWRPAGTSPPSWRARARPVKPWRLCATSPTTNGPRCLPTIPPMPRWSVWSAAWAD